MFRSRWRAAFLAVLLVFSAGSAEAQPPVRQVLLLQSFERGNLVVDYLTGNFRVELDRRVGQPVNVVQVVVGRQGSIGASEQAILDYIHSAYIDRPKPDLIVTMAGPAAVFARKHRAQLFPGTPLLLAGADERYLRNVPLEENEAAVSVRNDFTGLVEDLLRLLPETKQLLMITGSGPLAAFWRRELEGQFERFRGRLTLVWSDDLSLPELLRRCASLSPHSAILYLAFGTDAQGGAYSDERVMADLYATANAPLFGVQSVLIGRGFVGGALMSLDDLSRNAADAAVRLLHGALPATVTVPVQEPGSPVFDWRELQHWNIPESRLPAGSVVLHRPPGLWRAYRSTVLTALAVLAVQSLLIVGLLYQRRERKRAESDSRRNLALAADVSRRETMSALTSSIGHELGQPIGSIVSNAQALQMMVTANRATTETIGEILTDIQTQGVRAADILDRHRTMLKTRQLDKKAIDIHAVVTETLSLVEHNMTLRQVEARINLPSSPCVIDGDSVLLQQVFVNLVLNAVDAMTVIPSAGRCLTISSDVRATEVDVSVRDTGPGLPAHMLGTPFMPFVTTKAHGLGIGLTIAQSIVDAHGGTMVARNHPDGGAAFTVTLRRSAGAPTADTLH